MRRFLFLAIFLSLTSLMGLPAEGFWTVRELSDESLSELDGTVQLRFKDAVSAQPIRGLTLEVGGSVLTSDPLGVVAFPTTEIADIVDKDLPFRASAPGYITLEDTLRVRVGSLVTQRFVLSKNLPLNQARLVLEWEKRPADLDAVLTGPDFVVSYRSKKNAEGNANLDQDARHGYGPETLTLLNIRRDAKYVFSVQNYSKEAPMKNVKVSLYWNNRLDTLFWIPESSAAQIDLVRIANGQVETLLR